MDDSLKLPILSTSNIPSDSEIEGVRLHYDNAISMRHSGFFSMLLNEAGEQLSIAIPMVLVNILQMINISISLMFVGRLGDLELSAASMGSSFCSVTGNCLLIGLAGGLETLCGQAYGAKQYAMLGVYLQRSLLVLYTIALPTAVVWFNLGNVMIAVGQDPHISALAGQYAQWLLPGLLIMPALQALTRFLQSQGVTVPMAAATLLALLVHIPANWLFIYYLGYGVSGAAMAISLSYWVNVLALMSYVSCTSLCSHTWKGFTAAAFQDIPQFMQLAIPAASMICLEYWSFEIMVLLSGLMPDPALQVSALTIVLQVSAINYMIPYGLSCGVSTRVSNLLGAGHPQAARFSCGVSLVLTSLAFVTAASLVWAVRDSIGHLYTNVESVVSLVASLIPIFVLASFADAFQAVLSGVARGSGMQHIAAFVNLGAYYLVGLPLAATLGFYFSLYDKGLWIGLTFGLFSQMIGLSVLTCTMNWEDSASLATQRVFSSSDYVDATVGTEDW